jgi:hypothetical protein
MSKEHWWNDFDRGKHSTRTNPCRCVIFSTSNSTWNGLELNSGLRGDRSASDHITMTRLYDVWTRDILWRYVCPLQRDEEAFGYFNFMISTLATSFFEDLFNHLIVTRNCSAPSVLGDLQALKIYDQLFSHFSSMSALQPLQFYQ